MSFEWVRCPIPGLFISSSPLHSDVRGLFSKVVAQLPLSEPPLEIDEIYWSESSDSVVRGMHFQLPPFQGRKVVFVTHGEVRDFVLDMRVGSPTFRQHHEVHLNKSVGALLIPEGCAHGFEVLNGPAIVTYAQEGRHSISHDTGIRITSTGIELCSPNPEISPRDLELPPLSEFASPFSYIETSNAD